MTDPDYFTLADFRNQPDMSSETKYSDELVLSAAAYITEILEREVGTSFIERTVTETLSGDDSDGLFLTYSHVRSIESVKIDGVSITETPRSVNGVLYRLDSSGKPVTWDAGYGNVEVTYKVGYSAEPPGDVLEAVIKGTRAHLLETGSNASMNDRRTSLSTDMGVINFVVAGQDNPTGYPAVDAVILGWRKRLFQPNVG